MRRAGIALITTIITIMIFGGRADAREIRQGDRCLVRASEVIQGDLFVLCRELEINGTVEGDVIGAAVNAQLRGTITGDVYLAAGQMDVSGTMGEDLHFLGSILRVLDGTQFSNSSADLISLNLSTTLDPAVTLPDNLTAIAYQMILDGRVNGEVTFSGSALRINNHVGENIYASVGDPESPTVATLETLLSFTRWEAIIERPGLTIGAAGRIEGDLEYTGFTEGLVEGQIVGSTRFTPTILQADLTQIITVEEEESDVLRFLSQALREFVMLLIIGLVGSMWITRPFQSPLTPLAERPLPSLGLGGLGIVAAFPVGIILLVLIIAVVVLPLIVFRFDTVFALLTSITLLGTWAGIIGTFFFTALFISRAMVAFSLGRWIVRVAIGDDGSRQITLVSLFVGTILMALLVSIPIIGWVLSFVAACMGLGAIISACLNQLRRYRNRVPTTRVVPSAAKPTRRSKIPPLPMIEDERLPPGMKNLPDGFDWWDD
jgi:cytoskeletal protein CcmA (bactofilin family)